MNLDTKNCVLIEGGRSAKKILEWIENMNGPTAVLVIGPDCPHTEEVVHAFCGHTRIDVSEWNSSFDNALRAGLKRDTTIGITLSGHQACNDSWRKAIIKMLREDYGIKTVVVVIAKTTLKQVVTTGFGLSAILQYMALRLHPVSVADSDYVAIIP